MTANPNDPSHLSVCSNCSREIGTAAAYDVATKGGFATKCLACALRHSVMLRRSTRVAVVVGTLLVLLNQGDKIVRAFQGNIAPDLWWKVPLTYCVPFCVATYGALGNARRSTLSSDRVAKEFST